MTRWSTTICVVPFLALACASEKPADPVVEQSQAPVVQEKGSDGNPPRIVRASGQPNAGGDDAGTDVILLHQECGPREPFMCSDPSGKFYCSSRPCLPDCTRVGCVGGEECRRCTSGAHHCVVAGGSC